MTDNDDNTNVEPHISVNLPLHASSMQVEIDDDFVDESDDSQDSISAGLGAAEGELTPNDIFGLDPLDVLTLEELAEYLQVSPAAARRAMKEQHLPGRNIGGEYRFLRDAVANWLRGQEAPAQEQQKAREDYSKAKVTPPKANEDERFSRPPQRPYQAELSGDTGGEYRPRQRFPEGGNQYGRQGGGEYGNRQGQYGNNQYGAGKYGGGSAGGGQSSGGTNQSGGGNYGGGNYGGGESGGNYTRPPRRPFRSAEGGGSSGYGASGSQGGQSSGGGYSGGGGYGGGGQSYGGGPKRKNKRQVFDNERGKRLDRRKEGQPEGESQE